MNLFTPESNQFPEEGAIIPVDKPSGWTSFDVVKKIRGLTGKKTGHGGTLDPLATGLLLIGTGTHTKLLHQLQNLDKVYEATIHLGATTPSYDAETPVQHVQDISSISEADIIHAVKAFTGEIQQHPPPYSAIKVKGEKLYHKARRGEKVVTQPRKVHVYRMELLDIELPLLRVRIHCSKGTYIRSLAHDIGKFLGVGGYLEALRRLSIGQFDISQAWQLESLVRRLESLKTQ